MPIVVVHMRRIGMAWRIAEVPIWLSMRRSAKCLGTMRRSRMTASTWKTSRHLAVGPTPKRKDKHYRQKADNSIHEPLLHRRTLNSIKTIHENGWFATTSAPGRAHDHLSHRDNPDSVEASQSEIRLNLRKQLED